MQRRLLVLIRALAVAGLPAAALGDAIVITQAMKASTIAEFFIEEGVVRVELEIGLSDLEAFQNLLPGELLEMMGREAEPLVDRLPRFFGEDLTIRQADGDPLPGRVVSMGGRRRVKRDEVTGEPLPAKEGEGEAAVFAELAYRFEGRPEALRIKPPLDPDSGFPRATIGFVAYHSGLPVNDFRYLGREETVDLDWNDPWYSRFRNKNLWRQYNAPINAFLYVEPYEVRVEIIARPFDLQQWVDLGIAGRATIPVDLQASVKEAATTLIGDHLMLTIDGRPVTPVLDRVNFLRRTLRTSTVVDPPEDLDAISATLGVIFVQPTDGLPQEASLTWGLYAAKLPEVRSAATDEAGPLPAILRPDDTTLLWKNFLKDPTIPTLVALDPPPSLLVRLAGRAGMLGIGIALALGTWSVASIVRRRSPARAIAGCAAAGVVAVAGLMLGQRARVTGDRGTAIVGALLKNVYHAFDFRDEGLIYDALEHSVSGDLLTDTFLEVRQGLELASQGGARVKVKSVDVQEAQAEELGGGKGFRARCTWNVSGSVGHWGHVHQRTNRYHAALTIEPVDGVWKITGLELLEEERLS